MPSHAHSTVNLLSLNLDVISEILLFLSPGEAHRLALTSRESYSVAIRRALSRVVVSGIQHAELFFSCVLSYAPEKLLLIQDLEFYLFPKIDKEHAPLLADLLAQTRNLKCLRLEKSKRLFSIEPRIGEAIAALRNIVELSLMDGGELTLGLLLELRSKPLRLVHASGESWADHTPLFTSPALRDLETLRLRCVDNQDGICISDVNYPPYLALRVLRLEDLYMPMYTFVRAFPNIRMLYMSDVGCEADDNNAPHPPCWPSLDHVSGQYHYMDMWRVTCPVHNLELSSVMDEISRDTTESETASILRAVKDMSPVVLTMEVNMDHGPGLWLPLVTVVPRLVCLTLDMRLETSVCAPLLTWTETVPPILTSLKITCLKVYVEAVYCQPPWDSPEPSTSTDEPDFDFFRAVVQIIPATLAKSITSLKYLSFATLEIDLDGPQSETNFWWRLSELEGRRVMEPFSSSEGEDLLERLRSEPGAESAILSA